MKRLPAAPRIADVATGTGVFLDDLSRSLSSEASLHGFDMSDKQFPDNRSRKPNMHFHVHDARTAFPVKHHGMFDVVHIRLLLGALRTHDDWQTIARNSLQLLKPGGVIQWSETSFAHLNDSTCALRSLDLPPDDVLDASARLDGIWLRISPAIMPWLQLVKGVVPRVLRECGCEQIGRDVVNCDRTGEDRAAMTETTVAPWIGLFRWGCRDGLIANGGPEEVEAYVREIEDAFREAVVRGYYLPFEIRTTVGVKTSL